MILAHHARIIALAATHRIPTIYGIPELAEAGGLMTYGVNLHEQYRRGAIYVDKILKGATPGDLPVEQPAEFELVINLKTANQLGITIPPFVLYQATKIIR